MPPDHDIAGVLKARFGYDRFLPLQEEVIANVLDGKDSLVLMPTGGGKSLCYQLPALCQDGLTLVVSPLIALMKDQVDALETNGVPAAFVNSTLSYQANNRVQVEATRGRLKILYVAPERLATPRFRDFLRTARLSLIAVDEAHCISEWGHDFRPDYRNLKGLRNDFPGVPTIALTATATERVRSDIVDQLGLGKAARFVASFNRPNLTYVIRPKRRAFDGLVELLGRHHDESAIVYCFSRKDTEGLATDLTSQGIDALPYHAGLDDSVRKDTQDRFINDDVPVIVATIAFGMGIDKPDIRLVVHYDLPKTLEGYYQETGRAGRDGLPSECVLFYSYGDKVKQDFFIEKMEDAGERAHAEQKLAKMVELCEARTCRREFLLGYFGERWEAEGCGGCDMCLAEREEFDSTEIAQKILSAVIRTGERFGANHVIEVLRGARTKGVLQREHDLLSVYGVAASHTADELKELFRLLLAADLLVKATGEYATFGVTDAGRTFLQRRDKLILERPRRVAEAPRASAPAPESLDYDLELFERLRALRKRLADELHVPPFVVFGDRALQQMAYYVPQTREGFAGISGVGEAKLEQFSDAFLEAIRAFSGERGLSERAAPRREKPRVSPVLRAGSTYDETRKLVLDGLNVGEIARRRKLSQRTVVTHLERLVGSGESLELGHLMPPEARFSRIEAAIRAVDGDFLAPVLHALGEGYSYEELRLVRLHLQQAQEAHGDDENG